MLFLHYNSYWANIDAEKHKKSFINIIIILLLVFTISCNSKNDNKKAPLQSPPTSNLSGEKLAILHCGKCHSFVKPELLTKTIWKEDVLPSMGFRLGIYNHVSQRDSLFDKGASGEVIRQANVFPDQPQLAAEDWKKIVDYYTSNAPERIEIPVKDLKIKMGLRHFTYREANFAHRPALTSMVKILPNNQGFVFADSKKNRNILTFLNPDLSENYSILTAATPINFVEKSDTLLLTMVGNGLFPTDASDGSLQLYLKKNNRYQYDNTLISNLKRPVAIVYGDLNNDGLEDKVICEFGNQTGNLGWFQNMGNEKYKKNTLRNLPGATKAIIKDINNDGLMDIIALMAQGDEGIFAYINKGNNEFEEKNLIRFLPLNGSQSIELIDINKDGFDDIIYSCGDNADKTPVLKNYHGIYIFEGDGKLNFKQSYFFQLNGAYQVIAKDFDLDGDLDMAAISFFPDYRNTPEESFVYLENNDNQKFTAYSFPEATKGRWIVMDAADMDNDGDIDIVLGSFVYFKAEGNTTGLGKSWLTSGPSIVILENTVR